MFFVYILKSLKDEKMYIGKTNDVVRRFREHNTGQVSSTKSRRPFILLKQTPCKTEQEALLLEKQLKKGYKREGIKKEFNL